MLIEFCNPLTKILCSISNQTLNEIGEKFIKGKPNISLNCECFHYEERSSGRNSTRTVKVVTHRQSLNFNYRYYRDISGRLIFNPDEKIMNHKYYIYLKIINKAYLSDENSISHYESLKNTLEANRNRDTYFSFYENVDIEGQPNEYFIKRKDKDSWFVNSFWYIIFTMLTFAEPYKLYIKIITYCHVFEIKKVISIENNVNLDQRFDSFKPSLYIRYGNQHFQLNEINLNRIDLPLENEINNNIVNNINNVNINGNNNYINENDNNQPNNINRNRENEDNRDMNLSTDVST